MMNTNKQGIFDFIQILIKKQIKYAVLSPGSRNAPFAIALANSSIKTIVAVDERSAAFIAIGIIKASFKPVAIFCTSGSALANYYPAVLEAYYSNLPLIIVSSDRPDSFLNKGHGQTINQVNIFANHIKYFIELSENMMDYSTRKQNQQIINKILNYAINKQTPIHINCKISEPLYKQIDHKEFVPLIKLENKRNLSILNYDKIYEQISTKKKILIVAGSGQITKELAEILSDLQVPILTEAISNFNGSNSINYFDLILINLNNDLIKTLKPDLIINFGSHISSKRIKNFLNDETITCWYLKNAEYAYKQFSIFSYFIEINTISEFFKFIKDKIHKQNDHYLKLWQKQNCVVTKKLNNFKKQNHNSELTIHQIIFNSLENQHIHLANSMAVRFANYFNHKDNKFIFYANKGTNGIDGSVSTALGHALSTDYKVSIITGDLSFFYDSNAFLVDKIPQNFKIIVINNFGGGIFKQIDGPNTVLNYDKYFIAKHKLSAKYLAKMYNLTYYDVINLKNLANTIKQADKKNQACIIEIFNKTKQNENLISKIINFFKTN